MLANFYGYDMMRRSLTEKANSQLKKSNRKREAFENRTVEARVVWQC